MLNRNEIGKIILTGFFGIFSAIIGAYIAFFLSNKSKQVETEKIERIERTLGLSKSKEDLSKGLIAYFEFNESLQSTGFGNVQGFGQGEVGFSKGQGNDKSGALNLNGESWVKTSLNVSPKSFSLMSWIYWDPSINPKTRMLEVILAKDDRLLGKEHSYQIHFSISNTDFANSLRFHLINEKYPVKSQDAVFSKGKIPIRVWTQVAVCYDHDSNKLKFFINGKVDSEHVLLPLAKNSHATWMIGAGYHTEKFRGKVDNIRLYSHSLSDSEIKNLYDSEKPK